MERCSIPSCKNTKMSHNFFDGKSYCVDHYDEIILEHFHSAFASWEIDEDAPYRFKYLLGRILDEKYMKVVSESYLTNARVRDRGFNYMKLENGCTFEIVRHLNAWHDDRMTKNIVEKWRVKLDDRTFERISTRDYTQEDQDREREKRSR